MEAWWPVTSHWQILVGNLAVVALFVLGWAHARYWLRDLPGPTRALLFGLAMGMGTVATMLMTAEISAGRFADLRGTLLALSAFLGGPVAAAVTALMALGWRLGMGGAGLVGGSISIVLTVLLALGLRFVLRDQQARLWHALALAGLVAAVNLVMPAFTQPWSNYWPMLVTVSGPLAILNLAATALSALVIMQARRLAAERDLLAAALAQSPDYAYVKDANSRFAAVNLAVAELHGFHDPAEMIGRTDFDLASPERARALFEDEQRILAAGVPMLDREEQLADHNGQLRWFHTSKVPLHDAAGQIIGLAGVTRDITADKQLRTDLIESRDMLSYALAEMSDGLAMFDVSGRLVFCNQQYRDSFPYTGEFRQPGVHISQILRFVVETGEQLSVPQEDPDKWVAEITANLNRESEEEIALFDGRWLQLRTRPTSNGSTMVVVSDVTRLKQAELALHSATDQLKHLVRTDSLTGLLNRRAFDDAIESEVRRTARTGTPLSLLIIDIDRFKAYNDRYGHPEGDECLRQVAQRLKSSFKRPADVPARYGGEEFAAILPDTDEDGAYQVAETFRRELAAARIPHAASERGYVTASVGVATYMPDNLHRSAAEIIAVADEMLYGAKAAGRDRVLGTRIAAKERRYAAR